MLFSFNSFIFPTWDSTDYFSPSISVYLLKISCCLLIIYSLISALSVFILSITSFNFFIWSSRSYACWLDCSLFSLIYWLNIRIYSLLSFNSLSNFWFADFRFSISNLSAFIIEHLYSTYFSEASFRFYNWFIWALLLSIKFCYSFIFAN